MPEVGIGGSRPRLVFVAAFPPPITGQTVATEAHAELAGRVADVTHVNWVDPGRHGRPSGRFDLAQLRRVRAARTRVLREGPWDVGCVAVASSTLGRLRDLALLRALKGRATRVVALVHQGDWGSGSHGILWAPWRRAMLDGVHRFVFLTDALADDAPWVPRDRVSIVPNTAASDVRFTDDEVREAIEMRAADAERRILLLANALPGKGHHRLAEALLRVASLDSRSGPPFPVTADLVGAWPSDAERASFVRRIQEMGLRGRLRIHGKVEDRARVRRFLLQAHALAFPSTYASEAFPLAVVEALGAGTPVVTLAHRGLGDIVRDGVGGRAVPVGDPDALAQALSEVLAVDGWLGWARNARARYLDAFSPPVVERVFLQALFQDTPSGAITA